MNAEKESTFLIVTGASSGIGLSILRSCLADSISVLAVSRTISDELKSLRSEFRAKGLSLKEVTGDVRADEAFESFESQLLSMDKVGRCLGMVANAGCIMTSSSLMPKMEQIEEMLSVNYLNTLKWILPVTRKLLKYRKGSIVYVSSNAVTHSFEGRAGYAASKAAMATYLKVMAREIGSRGVRCNIVSPGLTETKLMRASTTQEGIEDTLSKSALQKIADPNEIADTILFLISDKASHISGQDIVIDGGV